MTEEDSASIHTGYLEQKLARIERQMDQLRSDVESVVISPMACQLSGQDAAKELGYSLRAELLRLQHELNLCESELLRRKAQMSGAEPH